MPDKYVAIRDGGKTNEEGATRLLAKLAATQNEGILGTGDFLVEEDDTPSMDVKIAAGDLVIGYLDYFFHVWSTVSQTLTIGNADPSNDRIDRIVAYVDLDVVDDTDSNNPDAILFMDVEGTPAGSPTAPDDAAVQTAVGAGNPWVEIARITVGDAVSSIVNANITDSRPLFRIGGGAGVPPFTAVGNLAVLNNITPYWVAPQAGTITAIYARVKTAPTGAALNLRVNKNGVQVATLSISAGGQNTSSTGLSISYAAGDYFSLDVTQIGSSVPGADLTVSMG